MHGKQPAEPLRPFHSLPKSEQQEIACWQEQNEDQERIRSSTLEEAIEYSLTNDVDLDDVLSGKIDCLTFIGYKRKPVIRHTLRPLERLLEILDEEYGDPDNDDGTEPTTDMNTAESKFLDAVLKDYAVFWCEAACTQAIPPLSWLKEKWPHWIKDHQEKRQQEAADDARYG